MREKIENLRAQLGSLTDAQLCHLSGQDFAYFRPEEVLAAVELSDTRLETIKAMSCYLDDVAEALGVTKPSTPVEGIGACWKVMEAIQALTAEVERLQTELWCVHVQGPDDILAMPSKDFAERVATNLNKGFDELKGDDIHIKAKVIPYPYTKEGFDKALDSWADLVAGDWG